MRTYRTRSEYERMRKAAAVARRKQASRIDKAVRAALDKEERREERAAQRLTEATRKLIESSQALRDATEALNRNGR